MIEVTEAVKRAREIANQLYEGEDIKNLGLEEVVFNEEANAWEITLGYDSYRSKIIENKPTEFMARNLYADGKIEKETLREYKTFSINAENGQFQGMIMRDIG
ncbi:hypothetical protein [Psychrobacter sanguinis]|uniref:Uncharacterized protein n=1 Tax=Psychrobacter sanguinis TaxID=861445 RepID=A0A844M141_9GAMM|nr:hypothetical protein [Psychrobacter sanguinis]MUG32390.1 hypothetical protein [Psychrobacter sanguinis]